MPGLAPWQAIKLTVAVPIWKHNQAKTAHENAVTQPRAQVNQLRKRPHQPHGGLVSENRTHGPLNADMLISGIRYVKIVREPLPIFACMLLAVCPAHVGTTVHLPRPKDSAHVRRHEPSQTDGAWHRHIGHHVSDAQRRQQPANGHTRRQSQNGLFHGSATPQTESAERIGRRLAGGLLLLVARRFRRRVCSWGKPGLPRLGGGVLPDHAGAAAQIARLTRPQKVGTLVADEQYQGGIGNRVASYHIKTAKRWRNAPRRRCVADETQSSRRAYSREKPLRPVRRSSPVRCEMPLRVPEPPELDLSGAGKFGAMFHVPSVTWQKPGGRLQCTSGP